MVAVIGRIDDSAVLASLVAGGLVESGRLVVISVEEIRNRVGARWTSKHRTVWEFAQREFKQQFSPVDQIIGLGDCCYLLVQPEQAPAAAQGRAINFLRDILQFFLGENVLPAMSVGRVVQIQDGVVRQEHLSDKELAIAEQAALRAKSSGTRAQTQPKGVLSSLATEAANRFIIDYALHPIWSRKKNAIVSYRMKPTVCEMATDGLLQGVDPTEISTRELIGIDLIILDKAIQLLAGAPADAKFGLYAPLHISTMNSMPGRQAVFSRLSNTPSDISKRLVIGLKGLAGTPRVVLDTAVGTLLPFVLGVVGQAPHLEFDPTVWRGARLSAISCDISLLDPEDRHKLPAALGRFAASAEGIVGTLGAHGVATRAEALAAWAAGFTMLSGPFLSESADVLRPMRFEATDLYRNLKTKLRPPALEQA